MDYHELQMWRRVEKRLGAMVGEALAAKEFALQGDQELAWTIGLLRAWEQVKELVHSGRVLKFDEPTMVAP